MAKERPYFSLKGMKRIVDTVRKNEATPLNKAGQPDSNQPAVYDFWIETTGAALVSGLYYYSWKKKRRISNSSGVWEDHPDGLVSHDGTAGTYDSRAVGDTMRLPDGSIVRCYVDLQSLDDTTPGAGLYTVAGGLMWCTSVLP